MPELIRWTVLFIGIAAVVGVAVAVTRPRGRTTVNRQSRHGKRETSAQQARREAELADLREASADKPPYQPPTPGFPPTAGQAAIRKLPGQDRLTRNGQGEQHVRPDAISAAADDHLSGGPPPLRSSDPALAPGQPPATGGSTPASSPAPSPPATTAMPAVRRPAVPGTPSRPPVAPPVPAGPQPAPPAQATDPETVLLPRLEGETRAQRRRRLEALIEAEALQRGADPLSAPSPSPEPRPAPRTPGNPS